MRLAEKPGGEAIRWVIEVTVCPQEVRHVGTKGRRGPEHQPWRTDKMIMSNSLNLKTDADCENLSLEQLETVSGGRETVVIVGCTTPPPFGGYPPGTITINPWLGSVWRW